MTILKVPVSLSAGCNSSSTLVVRKTRWSSIRNNPSSCSSASSSSSISRPSTQAALIQEAKLDDKIVNLHLLGVALDESIIKDLIELLKCRTSWAFILILQCTAPSVTTTATTTNTTMSTSSSSSSCCSLLTKTLAEIEISQLVIQESPDVVNTLLLEQRIYGTKSLSIRQRQPLTNTQCLLLGKLISLSKTIKELSLRGTQITGSSLLAPGLGISYHLERLSLADTFLSNKGIADLIIIPKNKNNDNNKRRLQQQQQQHGVQAISRLLLLSTTKSNLRALDLSYLNLTNSHIATLGSEIVPNSRLEELNLSFNKITNVGMERFVKFLPQMTNLIKLALLPNPIQNGQSLCDAMKFTYSIEYLDSLLYLPEATMLRYYTTINRGGRRYLEYCHHCRGNNNNDDDDDHNNNGSLLPPPPSPPLPSLNLWSKILERAGSINYHVEDEVKARVDATYYLVKLLFFQSR